METCARYACAEYRVPITTPSYEFQKHSFIPRAHDIPMSAYKCADAAFIPKYLGPQSRTRLKPKPVLCPWEKSRCLHSSSLSSRFLHTHGLKATAVAPRQPSMQPRSRGRSARHLRTRSATMFCRHSRMMSTKRIVGQSELSITFPRNRRREN